MSVPSYRFPADRARIAASLRNLSKLAKPPERRKIHTRIGL
jgi:hypothetical protein